MDIPVPFGFVELILTIGKHLCDALCLTPIQQQLRYGPVVRTSQAMKINPMRVQILRQSLHRAHLEIHPRVAHIMRSPLRGRADV